MHAAIAGLEYYLPDEVLSTDRLSAEFPEWGVEKIDAITGIHERHIAAPDQCSSDLAVQAAQKLFASGVCTADSIDYLLLCTQTPDHFLPPTACLVQDRLSIPRTAGALDFNLGSSGYVYGLGLAEGLISTGQASNVLLITADTYSKLIHPKDKSVRTIFGDAASATLVHRTPSSAPHIGPFVYGTDGSGAENLIVPRGGMRLRELDENPVQDEHGNVRTGDNLYMNGAEIFTFTLSAAPSSVTALLARAELTLDDVDLVIFHQANKYMLEHLRKRMKIPVEKVFVSLSHVGNTVSCTIPIALKDAITAGRVNNGSRIMLVGFGVGYSWGATMVRWTNA